MMAWREGVDYEKFSERDENGNLYRKLGDYVHITKEGKRKTIPHGMLSDGATLARDLCPRAFFTHDAICDNPYWDDGTPITNREASREYARILKAHGFPLRARIRFIATWLFGGREVKRVGGWW
jgi:hypothetical protein